MLFFGRKKTETGIAPVFNQAINVKLQQIAAELPDDIARSIEARKKGGFASSLDYQLPADLKTRDIVKMNGFHAIHRICADPSVNLKVTYSNGLGVSFLSIDLLKPYIKSDHKKAVRKYSQAAVAQAAGQKRLPTPDVSRTLPSVAAKLQLPAKR